jgi:hypothetical protein
MLGEELRLRHTVLRTYANLDFNGELRVEQSLFWLQVLVFDVRRPHLVDADHVAQDMGERFTQDSSAEFLALLSRRANDTNACRGFVQAVSVYPLVVAAYPRLAFNLPFLQFNRLEHVRVSGG